MTKTLITTYSNNNNSNDGNNNEKNANQNWSSCENIKLVKWNKWVKSQKKMS